MTSLFLMYAFITGIFTVLLTVYCCVACSLYSKYRQHGLTRKQSILAMWRMYDE